MFRAWPGCRIRPCSLRSKTLASDPGLCAPRAPDNFERFYVKQNERVQQLTKQFTKQVPMVTQEHRDGAKKLLEKHIAFEEAKDRSIKNELHGLAKDVGSFVHNAVRGNKSVWFGGIGGGTGRSSQIKCFFCGKHCSDKWTNAKDGKWYGEDHLQYAGLKKAQLKRERLCLFSKATKK